MLGYIEGEKITSNRIAQWGEKQADRILPFGI